MKPWINLLVGGLNRGCKEIVNELHDETVRHFDPHWILADRKADRAQQMASVLTNRFALRPQPVQMRVQNAILFSRDCDYVVLALDTLEDTLATLEARLPSQRVLFQITGRGPGGTAGTRLALQGTVCPDDHDIARAALLVLQTLAGMSQAASSRTPDRPRPPQRGSAQAAAPGGESTDSPASGRERAGA